MIGRDHLDCGSVASPYRETEGMRDGSDAIADWPILNALLNAVNGATWVSVHHGGGVGIGNSIHAGMVIVADGSAAAARRLERVLTSDPGMGVVRHADAGYPEAIACARERGVDLPMPHAARSRLIAGPRQAACSRRRAQRTCDGSAAHPPLEVALCAGLACAAFARPLGFAVVARSAARRPLAGVREPVAARAPGRRRRLRPRRRARRGGGGR